MLFEQYALHALAPQCSYWKLWLHQLPTLRSDHWNVQAHPTSGNAALRMQTQKDQELAQLRATEESQLATAVLSNFAEEQRERGEIAGLHSKHDVLRECVFSYPASHVNTARTPRPRAASWVHKVSSMHFALAVVGTLHNRRCEDCTAIAYLTSGIIGGNSNDRQRLLIVSHPGWRQVQFFSFVGHLARIWHPANGDLSLSTGFPLCSLAFKLRTAQVSKERSLQMQERELIDLQEKEYTQLSAEKLERERLAAVHAENEKQQNRRIENFKARDKLEVWRSPPESGVSLKTPQLISVLKCSIITYQDH
jgi:hypothetical protein